MDENRLSVGIGALGVWHERNNADFWRDIFLNFDVECFRFVGDAVGVGELHGVSSGLGKSMHCVFLVALVSVTEIPYDFGFVAVFIANLCGEFQRDFCEAFLRNGCFGGGVVAKSVCFAGGEEFGIAPGTTVSGE